MEVQQLRSFLAVARHGGYAGAAQAIHRTQPAVSSAVKLLERDLGRALFVKRGRRAVLTPAGEALVAEAGPDLERWEGLKDRLAERLEGQAQGTLRVGAGEAPLLYVLPRILAAFQKKFPKVRIVLRHQRASETLRELRAGELDLGFRSLISVPAWAQYKVAAEYPRVAVAAKAHPFARAGKATLAELSRHALLFPGSESITRLIVEEALAKAGLPYRAGLEAAGWHAIKTYAAAGFGVAVIPSVCLTPADKNVLVARDVSALFGKDACGLVVRRGAPLSLAARELVRRIDPRFPADP